MKILWIVNKPIGALHEKLFGKKSTGGLWMEAMLERARNDQSISIVIVNISPIQYLQKYVYSNNEVYYTIPGIPAPSYDYESKSAHQYWREILKAEQPQLIELWGTELPFGIPALEIANGKIPSVVYVQGILESIGRYYQAGLTVSEKRKAITIRDILTGSTIGKIQQSYLKRAEIETRLASMSKNIIVENQWAESYYMRMCRDVKVYKCPLSISEVFSTFEWEIEKVQPHTIMCSAANYPIKGLHMLLKALNIVKSYYPDVKLYIPGTPLKHVDSVKSWFKQKGYDRLINSMIHDLGLENVVSYTGRLTAEEMARKMSEINVFVMCSAIENHSSTLKEAMSVGVPCVASYVGGVPEYARNRENCMLYRYEDYEHLALNIISLFRSKELCQSLSKHSRVEMMNSREQNDFYKISMDIYQKIISNNKKD